MSRASDELSALWLLAEQRREAGEPPKRVYSPPYSIPPGDGDSSPRPWLTDEELTKTHELGAEWTKELADDAAGARKRLLAKIAKRNQEAA